MVLTGDGPRGPTGWSAEQRVRQYRPSEGWEVAPLLPEPRDQQKPRFVLKRSDGGYPDPSAAGETEALGLAQERYIDLRTRTDRGEAIKVLTLGEMVRRFLEREERRISNRPHEGITPARFRLIRNKCSGQARQETPSSHNLERRVLDHQTDVEGGGTGRRVHHPRPVT